MDNYNYPIDSDASWNQPIQNPREIEVTVSVTLSKTLKVQVDDYEIIEKGKENGNYCEDIDYSGCDIKNAVEEQYLLPQDKCPDWDVDEFEVNLG